MMSNSDPHLLFNKTHRLKGLCQCKVHIGCVPPIAEIGTKIQLFPAVNGHAGTGADIWFNIVGRKMF